ncbi:MAG: Uma2 family endonuclease [Candidatus Latescibacterota bacterium]|jgi:Uma2 family endonuclease
METKTDTLIEALYDVPEDGKAEIVNGGLLVMEPTGGLPSRSSGDIYVHLRSYEKETSTGYAFPDNTGFIVNLPNRRSFSPDTSYFVGELQGGKFLEGAPIFAVEVRSESDYGPVAEQKMAAKRADYFAAGTQVVWDVDVLRDQVIHVYRANDPQNPTPYAKDQIAEAEPALPGWTMPVNDCLP